MSKEVNKITLGNILSWLFGSLFLLMGIGIIGTGSPASGIIIILCSAMIIPYFNKIIAEKYNVKISGGVKFLLFLIIFVALGFSIANTTQTEKSVTSSSAQENTHPKQQ